MSVVKIALVSKTLRIHDNPFLDADVYIVLVDSYGPHQHALFEAALWLHLRDLRECGVNPVVLGDLGPLRRFLAELPATTRRAEIRVDYRFPVGGKSPPQYPFETTFVPTWSLIDWTPRVAQIRDWFLPEALRNHNVFKEFVVRNVRGEFKCAAAPSSMMARRDLPPIASNYDVLRRTHPLLRGADSGLDAWARARLRETTFMTPEWRKPRTSPLATLTNATGRAAWKSSQLSPLHALGILSPLLTYKSWPNTRLKNNKFWHDAGSPRDQLLFREMYHAAGQMPEFWRDDFGAAYPWKMLDNAETRAKWRDFVTGATGHQDLDWAVKTLCRDGWIHHLARHLIADYLTRGKLGIHWKYGAEFFRNELIDHDLAVNVGNWQWVSATAFSSKQRSFYHYNPDHFLRRLDADVMGKL